MVLFDDLTFADRPLRFSLGLDLAHGDTKIVM
jgi:hypothetical protein